MDRPTTLVPTLDHQRTDELRTFLTVEAAADLASRRRSAPARRGRRHLVGGIVAAAVMGAGLFAAAAIAGGPGSGPASVETAHAVAIEPAAPGWTKLSIEDIDADPDAVVAELQRAGIDARREALAIERDEEGRLTLDSFDTSQLDRQQDGGGFSIVGLGEAGDEGLRGLTVSAPGAGPAPLSQDLGGDQIDAAMEAYTERIGAKMGPDGSVEIRNDADVTVIVLTEG